MTLGAQRADLLIGVMSDAALERIAGSGSLSLGAEWSICLLQQGRYVGAVAPAAVALAAVALAVLATTRAAAHARPNHARRPFSPCSDTGSTYQNHDLAISSLTTGCGGGDATCLLACPPVPLYALAPPLIFFFCPPSPHLLFSPPPSCMFDFSVSAGHVCVDAARNRHTYGAGVDAAALLHGEVPLPQACEELAARMVEAEAQAAAACFEPSTRSESYW